MTRYPRLHANLEALAAFGRDPAGGNTRRAYDRDDMAARRWLLAAMQEAGLDARMDGAANVIGRLAPERPADPASLVIGSHIDTVTRGGTLDGALGVLAGIEVARALRPQAATMRRPLEIIAFQDEEGRFGAFTGSRAVMGDLDPAEIGKMRDAEGTPFAAALAAAGLAVDGVAGASRPASDFSAYIELHIEQGPVLEQTGAAVGVVEGIVGQVRLSITFTGEPAHAGTTPMALRRDAFAAAALFATRARACVLAEGAGTAVFTIGIARIEPGEGNVVPARAKLGCELRDIDGGRLAALAARVAEEATRAGEEIGVAVSLRRGHAAAPTLMDRHIGAMIEAEARRHGYAVRRLPSGAGHDAQIMARYVPAGMIFVPSRGGRSHCPEEATAWADIEAGVDVLIGVAVRMLADPRPPWRNNATRAQALTQGE